MAPIKFEEHIKEKLEDRRVKPSKQAWDKLSERLDAQDKNKINTPYWWLGIAASIIGVLFVVFQFLNSDTKINISPTIVETEETISQDSITQIANESVLDKDFNKKEKTIKANKSFILTELNNESIVNSDNEKEAVAAIPKEKVRKHKDEITKNDPVLMIQEQLSFEEQQIKDVVAKVEAMKNNNESVSEDDIDALLMEAQKEIRLNNLINETTGVVDANALLQDVEADLDQSFRSKVFEALKSSYNSVKTAVAQRNN